MLLNTRVSFTEPSASTVTLRRTMPRTFARTAISGVTGFDVKNFLRQSNAAIDACGHVRIAGANDASHGHFPRSDVRLPDR